MRAQLLAHSSAQLAAFLRTAVAAPLLAAAAAADRADRLGRGGPPRYAAGLTRRGWRAIGPPHKQRYARYSGAAGADAGSVGAQLQAPHAGRSLLVHAAYMQRTCSAHAAHMQRTCSAHALLQALRKLVSSAPFTQMLALLCGAAPSSVCAEARRFRPGLDYTLAHVGTLREELTIDATLCFVPAADAAATTSGDTAAAQKSELAAGRLWASGDVGGFECYVAADGGEETKTAKAAEVYRADDASEGVTSIHAMSNALSLTLRPPGTMKFVKYVSAAAPGSRWDVAAEYTV